LKKDNVSSIAQIINSDRSSDRLYTSRGVRTGLKRSSASFKSKRVYKSKLGFPALAFSDAEVMLIARFVEENYKSVCRKNYTLTSQSA